LISMRPYMEGQKIFSRAENRPGRREKKEKSAQKGERKLVTGKRVTRAQKPPWPKLFPFDKGKASARERKLRHLEKRGNKNPHRTRITGIT